MPGETAEFAAAMTDREVAFTMTLKPGEIRKSQQNAARRGAFCHLETKRPASEGSRAISRGIE
ncbi:MAG: hypothetical protein HZA46_01545 [Planctomycetales bacterium]|nr:hypothetical protein [Planctomycetales bacterium]